MKQTLYSLILLIVFSCNSGKTKSSINIAVSANMQYPLEELLKKFESKYNIKVESSSSSSGILATQIRNGAPFDIFISANMKYPSTLFQEGLATSKPKVYAYGTLIIWSLDKKIDLSSGIKSLLSPNIKTIGVANTEIAPYGIATIEALKNSNLYDSLRSKIVFGESVGHVNQYVQSEAVDIGITSSSVLYAPNLTNKGRSVIIDSSLYTPIGQGIVMLKNTDPNNHKNAKLFFDFVSSKEAAEIFNKFGYKTAD